MFEAQGYVDTNVADVIRVAGGSRASFYSYFTSKDDVLSVLVHELVDDLFAAATHPLDTSASVADGGGGLGDTGPGDAHHDIAPRAVSERLAGLESSIRQFMYAYRDRAPLLNVLDQATTTNAEFLALRIEIRTRFGARLEALLAERATRRADPDDLEPRTTAIALGGMVEDMARGCYLFGLDVDEEQAIHTLAVLWSRCLRLDRERPAEP